MAELYIGPGGKPPLTATQLHGWVGQISLQEFSRQEPEQLRRNKCWLESLKTSLQAAEFPHERGHLLICGAHGLKFHQVAGDRV